MACCADEDTCPMHHSASHPAGTTSVVSQSQADRCCAAAEGDESGTPVAAFAPSGALTLAATWHPLEQPARHPAPEDCRVPLRACPAVPTHLLLSVFLV